MKNKGKKAIKYLCAVITVMLMLAPVCVYAEQAETQYDDLISDELDLSGADELYDGLDDEVKNVLGKFGVDSVSPEELLNIDFNTVINYILSALKNRMFTPVKIFALVAAVMLLTAVFDTFKSSMSEESAAGKVFSVVSVLSAFAVISVPITEAVENCGEVIKQSGNFMLGYVPVFMSSLIMSGKTASAGVFSSFLLTAAQVLSQTVNIFLLPLITLYLALSITASAGSTVNVDGMAQTAKKAITWMLGIMTTVFVGVMSFQSIVANSADTVGLRTAKFIIGSTVPLVGGAMSEAFNSLHACLGLLKSTLGIFGVVILAVMYIPIIIDAALIALSLNLASFIGDIFGDSATVKLTKSAASAITILLSILLFSIALNIVSIAAILAVTGTG